MMNFANIILMVLLYIFFFNVLSIKETFPVIIRILSFYTRVGVLKWAKCSG